MLLPMALSDMYNPRIEFVTITLTSYELRVKVKESRNRSAVTQRVPGGSGFQIFMTFGT